MADKWIEITIKAMDSYTVTDSISVIISVPEGMIGGEYQTLRDSARAAEDGIRERAAIERAAALA